MYSTPEDLDFADDQDVLSHTHQQNSPTTTLQEKKTEMQVRLVINCKTMVMPINTATKRKKEKKHDLELLDKVLHT